MAKEIPTRGLQVAVGRLSATADSFLAVQVMSADDRAVAFVAGDTNLGSPANVFDKAFDATPARTGQTVAHVTTFATGEANFNHVRYALHNDTTANVTGASNTLVAGVDAQSILKTSDYALKITLNITATDQS